MAVGIVEEGFVGGVFLMECGNLCAGNIWGTLAGCGDAN